MFKTEVSSSLLFLGQFAHILDFFVKINPASQTMNKKKKYLHHHQIDGFLTYFYNVKISAI